MAVTPMYEMNEAIVAMGGETLNSCMQCGLCAGLCPWTKVDSPFVVRKLIRMGQLGLEGFESDDILFACTTCRLCVNNCPREVGIIDVIRSMRYMMVDAGSAPASLRPILGSIHSNGNPWSGSRDERFAWAEGLDLPLFDGSQEYFLSICCTSNYDPRGQKTAQALIKVLTGAGVSFGVIGPEESCCGESARKIGDEELFGHLAESNIKLWQAKGVKKIITNSPHCYTTFTQEYPEMGAEVEVIHHSQLLATLIVEGKIKLSGELKAKMIFHDPCYLGRHSDLYDEPRQVLEAIPGAELAEFPHVRGLALCCGAGGGRLWMETAPENRFSDNKANQAGESGAQIIATACPYCLSMFEDSLKNTGHADDIQAKDLAELLAAVI